MTDKVKKSRRRRGTGCIYRVGRVFWIRYNGVDGKPVRESSHSELKTVAANLLDKRMGAKTFNIPIVKHQERVTFRDAMLAVVDDYTNNKRRSLKKTQAKMENHLLPFFGNRMLVSIDESDIAKFITHRMKEGVVNKKGVRVRDTSNGEINRELAMLSKIFSIAMKQKRIAAKPGIEMLQESAARSGFFEREQYESVLRHLPTELQPVIIMAHETGWRTADEVLPLQWRSVDFSTGEVRLDAGATKSGAGRVVIMTAALREMLQQQWTKHQALAAAGQMFPFVFYREVAKGRGGKKSPKVITRFSTAWKNACRAAGLPGKLVHDLRRTAIRNFVRSGISEHTAMRMSGHKTASVFKRYDIISNDDLRDAAQRLNVAAGRK